MCHPSPLNTGDEKLREMLWHHLIECSASMYGLVRQYYSGELEPPFPHLFVAQVATALITMEAVPNFVGFGRQLCALT